MEFQLQELEEIIFAAKEGSTPGSDLINYSLLKLLPTIAVQKLLVIFNRILGEFTFPAKWRECDIILLPKPNKLDFRPIALSSCVLKFLEKMIKFRLERFVELDLLFPPAQFGFRKDRSCEDCTYLLLEVYKDYINHDPMGAFFLDIKGAYDYINPSILFDMVNSIRIPPQYKHFIRNLISHRYIKFYESGRIFNSCTIFKGLPQGSSLSLLLFNLYIKDILNHIPYDCKAIQFADDIVLICSYKNINKITNSLQLAFNQIQDWLDSVGLELPLTKTVHSVP